MGRRRDLGERIIVVQETFYFGADVVGLWTLHGLSQLYDLTCAETDY